MVIHSVVEPKTIMHTSFDTANCSRDLSTAFGAIVDLFLQLLCNHWA